MYEMLTPYELFNSRESLLTAGVVFLKFWLKSKLWVFLGSMFYYPCHDRRESFSNISNTNKFQENSTNSKLLLGMSIGTEKRSLVEKTGKKYRWIDPLTTILWEGTSQLFY
jgi:hypothetical protein